MKANPEPITSVTIGGAEALLNSDLQGIIKEVCKLPHLARGKILSNGLNKKRRDEISLPRRWKWQVSPLDDLTDPLSSKSSHVPFFVSPADIGLKSTYRVCRVKSRCGRGLDANGWSMCTLAGTLGRLLRINPYSLEGPVATETPGICQHCMYGLSKRTIRDVYENYDGPTTSKTYAKAFKEHIAEPMKLKKLESCKTESKEESLLPIGTC
jgi:hypothetical protein